MNGYSKSVPTSYFMNYDVENSRAELIYNLLVQSECVPDKPWLSLTSLERLRFMRFLKLLGYKALLHF